MTKQFKDNLPLDGEVHIKDDVRIYLYHGYHTQDVNKCAVSVKGENSSKWVDRSLITPASESA